MVVLVKMETIRPQKCHKIHLQGEDCKLVSNLDTLAKAIDTLSMTYTISWPVPRKQQRILPIMTHQETFRYESIRIFSPDLLRCLQVQDW